MSFFALFRVIYECLDPEPERSSSPGSKATSEITPGSADDMCLSSWPLESRNGASIGVPLSHYCPSIFDFLFSYWFPNIGNTCFMNATLQCLLSLTCFWTSIIAQ
ncbi:hypothetical protein SRHO_G00060560 [Serrasalmus rhombeus]